MCVRILNLFIYVLHILFQVQYFESVTSRKMKGEFKDMLVSHTCHSIISELKLSQTNSITKNVNKKLFLATMHKRRRLCAQC